MDFSLQMPSSEIMFVETSSSFVRIYITIYIYVCEKLVSKTQSTNLGFTFETPFMGMALIAFWKRALHISRAEGLCRKPFIEKEHAMMEEVRTYIYRKSTRLAKQKQ